MEEMDILFNRPWNGAKIKGIKKIGPFFLSGVWINLWLYWIATFVGTSLVSILMRKNFEGKINKI